ncbi:hypothetical protein DP49_4582 [Burkholderia pseudomallei]|nr:hypothetical protein DP49_4582 [Burkholderia pseudomallei]KGX96705.1 hypothetical protein X997_5038 [Burkholderia pseudomallei A79C]
MRRQFACGGGDIVRDRGGRDAAPARAFLRRGGRRRVEAGERGCRGGFGRIVGIGWVVGNAGIGRIGRIGAVARVIRVAHGPGHAGVGRG